MLHEGHMYPRRLRVTLTAVHTLIPFLVSFPEKFAQYDAVEWLFVKKYSDADDLQRNVGRWACGIAKDGHRPLRSTYSFATADKSNEGQTRRARTRETAAGSGYESTESHFRDLIKRPLTKSLTTKTLPRPHDHPCCDNALGERLARHASSISFSLQLLPAAPQTDFISHSAV